VVFKSVVPHNVVERLGVIFNTRNTSNRKQKKNITYLTVHFLAYEYL